MRCSPGQENISKPTRKYDEFITRGSHQALLASTETLDKDLTSLSATEPTVSMDCVSPPKLAHVTSPNTSMLTHSKHNFSNQKKKAKDIITCGPSQALESQQKGMLTHSNISKHDKEIQENITHGPTQALVTITCPPAEEPKCYSQASRFAEWRNAMSNEFSALMHNATWTLVPPSPCKNLVGCKWVFKIKRKSDGTIDRYKAQLITKGFHQQPGIDFGETYSPVVKPTTIRLVLSLAVTNNWPIRQLDVQNAFLHGDLQEAVYMTQPPGFIHPLKPHHVCHLRKALYGLKQAPRAWYSRLSSTLNEMGFRRSHADTSLFIHNMGSEFIYILIYVDDILVTGPNHSMIAQLIKRLQCDFVLKDLGPLTFFLGIEAIRVPLGLVLSQQRYITNLLKKTNMDKAKPVASPMSTIAQLSLFNGDSFSDMTLYRIVVGSLQYLSLTRPDISFAVNKVCQFMHKPTVHHWSAVKRILRYLQQTLSLGLLIRKDSSTNLQAFSDSDWVGCPDDRRSTGGLCVFLGSNLMGFDSCTTPIQQLYNNHSHEGGPQYVGPTLM
jgi:hypothetical protein